MQRSHNITLDKDADVNAWGEFYSKALQAVLANGYEEVVTLLVYRGAVR